MRKIVAIVTVGLILITGTAVWRASQEPAGNFPENTTGQNAQPDGKDNPTHIRLFAAGDFIAHDSVNSAAAESDGSYNYVKLMPQFTDIFSKADLKFCNLPILTGGAKFPVKGYPSFNAPAEFAHDMEKLGCNIVNTASNHSFDFTQDYINASVDVWDGKQSVLAVAGQNRNSQEHDKVRTFSYKGIKFAFLAYTTYSNRSPANNYGVSVFSESLARSHIKKARADGAEFVIVSMRWGTEYSDQVNSLQRSQAKFLADQGVELVLGHGPHVVQPVEVIRGSQDGEETAVWYSLGNFINSQIPAETQFNGLAVLDIEISSKKIDDMRYLPIYQHYEWTAEQASAEQLGARKNLKLMLLENATQGMFNAHQLDTTAEQQKERLNKTLSRLGANIDLITSSDL